MCSKDNTMCCVTRTHGWIQPKLKSEVPLFSSQPFVGPD